MIRLILCLFSSDFIWMERDYPYGNIANMLFDRRHKKKVKTAWIVLSILIILSMILLYAPFF